MIPLTALILLLAQAEEWPQFRGPGGLGISSATGLPVEWGKDKGIRWKAELPGVGLSSPVIAGGRLYVTACSGPEQERLHVLCFDATSGARLWERKFRATGSTQCNKKTNMAAPTPAADGSRVCALFATGDLAALDRDGRLLWYRSLASDYPTIGNNVGMAASPVLHGDALFVAMENVGESFAAAFDARTGVNLWKHPRSAKINWTTPFVWTRGGRPEVLFQSPGELTAYDAASGSRLWSHAAEKLSTIPSPIAAGGQVFAPGGPFVALAPEDGAAKMLWEAPLPAATASPTLYKGRLYTVDSAGIVSCADPKDGKVLWKARTKGPYSASPLAAEDRLYLVNEAGSTTVLLLGEEGKVAAVNDLGDPMLASPAAAGGAIYLRSDRTLYCVGAP